MRVLCLQWRRPVLVQHQLQQQQQQQQQLQQQQQHSQSSSGSSSPRLPQSTPPSSTRGTDPNVPAAVFGSSSSSLQADIMCLANAATWSCRQDGLLLPVWAPGAAEGHVGSTGGSTAGSTGGTGQQHTHEGAGCTELPLVWLQVRVSCCRLSVACCMRALRLPATNCCMPSARLVITQEACCVVKSDPLPPPPLQSGSEPARLMAWHSGPLLVLLVLEPQGPASSSTAAVTATLASMLAAPASALAAQLSAELPARDLWHAKGLRYIYQDHLAAAVKYVLETGGVWGRGAANFRVRVKRIVSEKGGVSETRGGGVEGGQPGGEGGRKAAKRLCKHRSLAKTLLCLHLFCGQKV
jgi:hypothetical protein